MLKRSPRPLDRMQGVARRHELALGEEVVGSVPVGRVAVDGVGVGPDEEAVRGEVAAGGVGDVEVGLGGAGA